MELTKRVAHKPFIHEVPHAKGVVLFIHGILEGPYQFRGLADIANQNGYSSYAILLPGHGDSAERFSRIEKQVWLNYVEQTIRRLSKDYQQIIIVGHSMGCLLGLLTSLRYPQIKKAFLISTPLKLKLSFRGLRCSIKVAHGKVDEKDIYTTAIYRAWSIKRAKHLITYLRWIPRYLDLFSLVRETNKKLGEIKIPLTIVHCKDDEFVSDESINVFKRHLTCKYNVLELPKSGHFYFTEDEKRQLNSYFEKFITNKKVRS